MGDIGNYFLLAFYVLLVLLPVNVLGYIRAKKEREMTRKLLMTYWKIYGGGRNGRK